MEGYLMSFNTPVIIPPTPQKPTWLKSSLITYTNFTQDGINPLKGVLDINPLTTNPRGIVCGLALELVQTFDGSGGIGSAFLDLGFQNDLPLFITGLNVYSISAPRFFTADAGAKAMSISPNAGDNSMQLSVTIGTGAYGTDVTQGQMYIHLLLAELEA